jgi:hypothetical protein
MPTSLLGKMNSVLSLACDDEKLKGSLKASLQRSLISLPLLLRKYLLVVVDVFVYPNTLYSLSHLVFK